MSKLLVILGPTATGKTDLALFLAKKFNGELVSCDSRQIYQGLDIGTGKLPGNIGDPSTHPSINSGFAQDDNSRLEILRELSSVKRAGYWIVNGVKIWMYDVVSPKKQYTVYDYVKDAKRVLDDILKRGKLPIIVGGTGLYLKALLEGLPNLAVPINKELRKKLQRMSLKELQIKLQKISPAKWKKMNSSDRQNPRRLVRAIELAMSKHEGDPSTHPTNVGFAQDDKLRLEIVRSLSNVLKIGLTAPREILYKRADERVITRINQGMIEEAKKLHKAGLTFKRMKKLGLEYGVLADYLDKKIKNREELIKIMQYRIHGYVRRQLTWFKREKDVVWFDIVDQNYIAKVENLITRWYDSK